MTCRGVSLPGGFSAIVCGPKPRKKPCVGCGRPAALLCDWKVEGGTCDAPVCEACTTSPAPDKDICPDHRDDLRRWLESKR